MNRYHEGILLVMEKLVCKIQCDHKKVTNVLNEHEHCLHVFDTYAIYIVALVILQYLAAVKNETF